MSSSTSLTETDSSAPLTFTIYREQPTAIRVVGDMPPGYLGLTGIRNGMKVFEVRDPQGVTIDYALASVDSPDHYARQAAWAAYGRTMFARAVSA